MQSGYARLFVSLEWRVQFCLLVCCTYPSLSTVNKEKNQTDQSASLRVDMRETQQVMCSQLCPVHWSVHVGDCCAMRRLYKQLELCLLVSGDCINNWNYAF